MIILLIVNHPSDTVDGRHPAPVEVGSLSHYLQLWDPAVGLKGTLATLSSITTHLRKWWIV